MSMFKARLEQSTLNAVRMFCEEYDGGQWEWDSNLHYWVLQGPEEYTTVCDTNGFIGRLDAKTLSAGIAIFLYNHLAWAAHDRGYDEQAEVFSTRQYAIRDAFLDEGTEQQVSNLLSFID